MVTPTATVLSMPAPFPPKGRLYHKLPVWVSEGEVFHVRIRCDRQHQSVLTELGLAHSVLESVRHYHASGRWWCRLFLLMPDHLHALLAFPRVPGMSMTIRQWKAFHARVNHVKWQDGYFDHRIRNPAELDEKSEYIRQNPVAKGLCAVATEWPWMLEAKDLPEIVRKFGD
jgi:putative transposase